MEWEYWSESEGDIINALKFEERILRLKLFQYFPDKEKKLRVIYLNFSGKDKKIMANAFLDLNEIRINKAFVFSEGLDEAIDTLRHEFAHFFSFYEIGDVWIKRKGKEIYWPHNKNWKKWCRYLGCRPYAMDRKKCL